MTEATLQKHYDNLMNTYKDIKVYHDCILKYHKAKLNREEQPNKPLLYLKEIALSHRADFLRVLNDFIDKPKEPAKGPKRISFNYQQVKAHQDATELEVMAKRTQRKVNATANKREKFIKQAMRGGISQKKAEAIWDNQVGARIL